MARHVRWPSSYPCFLLIDSFSLGFSFSHIHTPGDRLKNVRVSYWLTAFLLYFHLYTDIHREICPERLRDSSGICQHVFKTLRGHVYAKNLIWNTQHKFFLKYIRGSSPHEAIEPMPLLSLLSLVRHSLNSQNSTLVHREFFFMLQT